MGEGGETGEVEAACLGDRVMRVGVGEGGLHGVVCTR